MKKPLFLRRRADISGCRLVPPREPEAALVGPVTLAAVSALPADPNVIWVTGPSKTADVEGILIEGVHGASLHVALLC